MADFACAWEDLAKRGVEPPSWLLVKRLMEQGLAGAIVPSFALGAGPANRNLVFWRWSDVVPHRVRVIDDEARLPQDDRSWEPKASS